MSLKIKRIKAFGALIWCFLPISWWLQISTSLAKFICYWQSTIWGNYCSRRATGAKYCIKLPIFGFIHYSLAPLNNKLDQKLGIRLTLLPHEGQKSKLFIACDLKQWEMFSACDSEQWENKNVAWKFPEWTEGWEQCERKENLPDKSRISLIFVFNPKIKTEANILDFGNWARKIESKVFCFCFP